MALYIAVCDNHVADRKQLERLLGREKDARLKTNLVLYIDFFGSSEALLNARIRYDLLLLDITNESASTSDHIVNSMDIAKHLRSLGHTAPIALCSSMNDDNTCEDSSLENIIYLKKPISQTQLSGLIDIALEKQKTKDPVIELRGKKDTCIITQKEILYAKEADNLTEVCMTNSRSFTMLGELKGLILQLSDPAAFAYCGKDCIVNFAHVSNTQKNALIMDNKDVLHFHFTQKYTINKAYTRFLQRFVH